MSTDKDCTSSPGAQTRRRFEANMVCGNGAEQLRWRVVLESPDRMRFALKATARHQGQTVTFSSTARWLQDSCNVRGIPIS